jgi:hypothetical protein
MAKEVWLHSCPNRVSIRYSRIGLLDVAVVVATVRSPLGFAARK